MSNWEQGSTRAWRAVRELVLKRDRYRCRLDLERLCPKHGQPCPGVCTGRGTCVHHTKGRAVTGDDPAYLLASCKPCNLHVGDPTLWPNAAQARPVGWA